MSPDERAYDSRDATIITQRLNNGDVLVTVHSGAVAIRIALPQSAVDALFAREPASAA